MALSTYTSVQTVQTADIQNAPCGFCQTLTGKLIFVYNPSAAHAGSGSVAVRIAASESDMNAGTVGSATTVSAEDATYYYSCGGATTIKAGANAGRVWLATNRATVSGSPKTLNVQFKYSDDEGSTWSSGINVTGVGDTGTGAAYGLKGHATAGEVIEVPQTSGQTLLLPVWVYDGSNVTGYARLLHSTDSGASWSIKSTIVPYSASYDTSEHHIAVVRMPSGAYRLVCSIVYIGSSYSIETCYSDDLGTTWSTMVTAITNASASPSILQLPDDSLVMIYRHLLSSENIWLARSTDLGATWPAGGRQVVNSSNRMRYGQWQNLLSGRLGLAYGTESDSTHAGIYWQPYISPLPARKRVGSRRGLSVWA